MPRGMILCLALITSARTFAQTAAYHSLDQTIDAIEFRSSLVNVLAARNKWRTLRDVREHLGRAMIYGIHPLSAKVAGNLRRSIRKCDMPDHLAVLTRAELEFAERLGKTKLSLRARYILAQYDIRTLADLRAETFARALNDDRTTIRAIAQLRAMGECPSRLQSEDVGEDERRHDRGVAFDDVAL